MVGQKPFLFLYSPRVGRMMGYAWVISPDEPKHPELELASLGSKARDSKTHHAGVIAVQHEVLQSDTGRTGDEYLICAGAVPESPSAIEAVRLVLETLLKNEVMEADLHQEYLIERSAFIYAAPCMQRISDRFHAHEEVRKVRWKIAEWEPDEHGKDSDAPSPKPRCGSIWGPVNNLPMLMKISLLVLLVVIAVIVIGGAHEKGLGAHGNGSATQDGSLPHDGLRQWRFLKSPEWERVLQATGGKELSEELKGGITDELGVKCEKWYKRFSVEFSLGDSPTQEPPPFLLNAKTKRGEKIASWIEDYMNQRSRYPSGIQKPAKSMDDFCKSVGDPPPEDLPKLVRDIWQAIDDFSKSVDGDLPDFRKLIAGQLNGLTPPPSGYETLTLKDAERLGSIQIILGSREYGMVEAGEKKTDSVQMDWNTIKEHIDGSLDYANKPPTNKPVKVLLRVLGDSFGLSQKKETTQ